MRLDAAAFSILLIGPVLAFAGQRQRPPANGLCVGFLADVIVRGLVSGAPAPGAGGTPLRSATVSIGEGPRQQRLTTDSAGRFTARLPRPSAETEVPISATARGYGINTVFLPLDDTTPDTLDVRLTLIRGPGVSPAVPPEGRVALLESAKRRYPRPCSG